MYLRYVRLAIFVLPCAGLTGLLLVSNQAPRRVVTAPLSENSPAVASRPIRSAKIAPPTTMGIVQPQWPGTLRTPSYSTHSGTRTPLVDRVFVSRPQPQASYVSVSTPHLSRTIAKGSANVDPRTFRLPADKAEFIETASKAIAPAITPTNAVSKSWQSQPSPQPLSPDHRSGFELAPADGTSLAQDASSPKRTNTGRVPAVRLETIDEPLQPATIEQVELPSTNVEITTSPEFETAGDSHSDASDEANAGVATPSDFRLAPEDTPEKVHSIDADGISKGNAYGFSNQVVSQDTKPSSTSVLKFGDDALPDHAPTPTSKTPPWSPLDIRNIELEAGSNQEASELGTKPISAEARRQANSATRLGFELIQRGAVFSARTRFIEALQIIARGLDDANDRTTHALSLETALQAYEEAGDFFPTSDAPTRTVDKELVVDGHTTKCLKHANVAAMTPNQCVREYLAFAEIAFRKALGGEEAASKSLYGLGRLELGTATSNSASADVQAYRGMALYQAAVQVRPANYAAANELGVLFAKYGHVEEAILALNQSASHSPHPTVLKNLASLHQKLGNTELARQVETQVAQLQSGAERMPFAVANPRIEWVPPSQFSQTRGSAPLPLNTQSFEPSQNERSQNELTKSEPSDNEPTSKGLPRFVRRLWPLGRSRQ